MPTNDTFGTLATTINGTFDALLEVIAALPVIATYNVQLFDSYAKPSQQNVVVVGGYTGQDADGGQTYAGTGGPVGNPPRMEQFTAQLVIATFVGGTDQKAARDAAFAIFTAIASWLRANPTIPWSGRTSGAVSRAQINTMQVAQTTEDVAEQGRVCEITVGILCDSYYLTA